ncbi:MAG: hypothetical protein KKH83_03625 [Candidatus Margulisbacteria bacterium]|nr:hypothetical protein [Candidatus Margulisiibacteriota bacterium]
MVIKSVLREELRNSLRMKKNYENELRKLKKGSLHAKKIKGHTYYYLILRKMGKFKLEYKGKLSKKEIEEYINAKKLREKYTKLLSKTKQQIAFLRKSLRGKEEV